ncbi:MAG TPA: HoxN/HupN/NixA family nickel/cobalt transporter [Janthinobacterium sp.]|nr:HoxN/HupN/NixA family nickel/cobalt transporter [Janthinobacterium sp.]
MFRFLRSVFNDQGTDLRRKVCTLYALLIAANGGAWIWAALAFHRQPVLLASAVLAYSLGLRHAVDADHIAAIDNVTRKLMQEGKRPITVGFFFSLGHSTVVTLLSVGIGVAALLLQSHFSDLKSIGGLVGTSISALYLFLLAGFNLMILISVCRTFSAVRRGEVLREYDLDLLLNGRGFLARLFRPLFRIATRSWHMFPMGLLFGLGFDTATEVALFGISAAEAAKGMPFWSIMVFPALFTAGMSLVDTTDGALMLGAYGWAFTKPIRKLFYNMTITLVSVVVAAGIAGVETLGLLREKLALEGRFWDGIGRLNDNFGLLGYGIIGLFIASWLVSVAVYKIRRYDEIEVKLT